MRKADLRFRDGSIISVELLIEWPPTIRYTRPRREDFRLLGRPYDGDKPVRVVDDVVEFHIDRASFDPERHWQNYIEAE